MLYEVKCYTPFPGTRGALGRGSQKSGGKASATEGHHLAFGNTEEKLLYHDSTRSSALRSVAGLPSPP